MADTGRTRVPAHLTAQERRALEAFVVGARAQLGAELYEMRLFGSRARGEGSEHSDLDVAVVVTPAGRARRGELYDLAFDLSLDLGVRLAPLVLERGRLDELRARERRLAADLDREGVVL